MPNRKDTADRHINVQSNPTPQKYPVPFTLVLILIGTNFLSHSWLHVTRSPELACDEEFTQNLLFAFAFRTLKVNHSEDKFFHFVQIVVTMVRIALQQDSARDDAKILLQIVLCIATTQKTPYRQ